MRSYAKRLNDLDNILSTVGLHVDREMDGTILFRDADNLVIVPNNDCLDYFSESYPNEIRLANERERATVTSFEVQELCMSFL